MTNTSKLYQLQKIDSQILERENRISDILKEIENDPEMNTASDALNLAEENVTRINKTISELNDSIHKKRIKCEQSESTLYSGMEKNPKVLQDLQTEIGLLKKQIIELENQLLEQLIEEEKANQTYNQRKFTFKSFETKFNTAKSILVSEKDKLTQAINRLKTERMTTIAQISPAHIKEYQLLSSNKQGIAVATLLEGSCSICGNTFTPAQCQAIRSQNEFFFCPTCHRIVYGD